MPQQRPLHLPLSYAQRRLWFLDRLEGTSAEYNLVESVRVRGRLNRVALMEAVATIVARHEILRTHFGVEEDEPVQIIVPAVAVPWADEDLQGIDVAAQAAAVEAAVRRESETPFDLSRGPLLRIRIVQLGDDDQVVVRTCHHIVSDGWSQGVFNRELSALYDAYRKGASNPLPELEVQYSDFALWQRMWLKGATLEEGLTYWKGQLAALPERVTLPRDRRVPVRSTFTASCYEMPVHAALTAELRRVSRSHHTTLYMTLLTALAVLLARYSGGDDIVVGAPIANRRDSRLEDLIGFFINTLVMRVRVSGGATFATLLDQVRQTALDAYRHQDVPFDQLVETLAPSRTLSVSPLVQVLLLLQNAPRHQQRFGDAVVEPLWHALRVRYDLEVHVRERAGALVTAWLYKNELFDRWRVEQMACHYARILEALVQAPAQQVDAVALLTKAERATVMAAGNAIGASVEPVPPLVRLWDQCGRVPDPAAPALECGARVLDYITLRTQTRRIGRAIRAVAGPGELVGIVTDDRMTMAVAVGGAVAGGAGFVPLDPVLPDQRLRRMVAQCAPRVLLVDAPWRERVGKWGSAVVLPLEACLLDPHWDDQELPVADWEPHAAYVYFTSGSTGSPKGVAGRMTSLEQFVAWEIAALAVGSEVRVSQLTPPGFDPYMRDLFVGWCAGGTVCIPADLSTLLDGSELVRWLAAAQVTLVHCVPTVLRMLLAEPEVGARLPKLRYVLSAGEPLLPADVQRWMRTMRADVRLLNLYGPTETTLAKFAHRVKAADGSRAVVPVGRPLPGTAAIVMDRSGDISPFGVVGQIAIATPFRSWGYHKAPAQTAEAFRPNPCGASGDVLYRTGDLGRQLPDGTFECLGRCDRQVKIRGHRVEIGEIETAVLEQPGVRQVAVVAWDAGEGEKRLAAYVVGEGNARQWSAATQRRVPAYMVPSVWVALARLPVTPHGKVDWRALPPPEAVPAAIEGRAVRTADEELLCAIFADVLRVATVNPDDDFFALGGHSLMAMRLLSRIRAAFGVDLSILNLFETSHVFEIADLLQARGAVLDRPMLSLRPAGNLPPLVCVTATEASNELFSSLMRHVGHDHPVFVLDARRAVAGESEMSDALAIACLGQIRNIQPKGPYQLFGWRDGGWVVHAIACRLRDGGEDVALLAMFDSRPTLATPGSHAADTIQPSRMFDGNLLFMACENSRDWSPVDEWKAYCTGRIDVCRVRVPSEEKGGSERGRDIGSILGDQLSGLM